MVSVSSRIIFFLLALGPRVGSLESQPGSLLFSLLQALHMLPVYSRNNALF